MSASRQKGWWYPYIFVGAFLVVVGVNGALAYFATSTFNGLETEQAYEKGIKYNDEIAAAEAQEALGWESSLEAVAVDAGKPGDGIYPTALRFTVVGPDGTPIEGLDVSAVVRRPTVAGYDHEVTLPPAGAGVYAQRLDLPMPGQWEVRVIATRADGTYRLRERIFVR